MTNKTTQYKEQFAGTVILGNNGRSDNPMVAVWNHGAIINVKRFKPFAWTSPDGKDSVRIYCNAPFEVELISKAEAKQRMAIENLNSGRNGFKLYKGTPIGDVLYITYDTNQANWLDAVKNGFIDRGSQIHLEEEAV